ncbi:MAG TPA: hypothetical protein VMT18_10235, partial [Planctomycetota bacterium]|nr:hypothetical protein [Planctomycetota bacterium]
MNVPARLFLVLCLLPLGTGCASWCKVKISRSELDRQFGELGLRYVAREDGFTLWSHYTRFASPAWVEVVAAERAAVIGALGGDAPVERVQVVLVPVEGLAQTYGIGADGSLEVRAPAGDPMRGLGGWADEQTVNVPVPAVQVLDHPEHGPITSHAEPEGYRRTLRH